MPRSEAEGSIWRRETTINIYQGIFDVHKQMALPRTSVANDGDSRSLPTFLGECGLPVWVSKRNKKNGSSTWQLVCCRRRTPGNCYQSTISILVISLNLPRTPLSSEKRNPKLLGKPERPLRAPLIALRFERGNGRGRHHLYAPKDARTGCVKALQSLVADCEFGWRFQPCR